MSIRRNDRQELADQRPIGSSKPAVQREEAGTAGIRQISTLTSLSRVAPIGRTFWFTVDASVGQTAQTIQGRIALRRGRQMFDCEWRQLASRHEPENLAVEGKLGLQRANDILRFPKAMAFAGKK
jgi:hypothetical protein